MSQPRIFAVMPIEGNRRYFTRLDSAQRCAAEQARCAWIDCRTWTITDLRETGRDRLIVDKQGRIVAHFRNGVLDETSEMLTYCPCATTGCKAMARVVIGLPTDEGGLALDEVCRTCADHYLRRPALKAQSLGLVAAGGVSHETLARVTA